MPDGVTPEELPAPPVPGDGHTLVALVERFWAESRREGRVPPTAAEVEACIKAERDSWDH